MLFNGQWQNRPLTISLKPNCMTISLDHVSQAEVLSYDLEGRLWTAFRNNVAYRRGLDGRILTRWRRPGDERERRWLSNQEITELISSAQKITDDLYHAILNQEVKLNRDLIPEGLQVIQRAAAFNPERSTTDAAQYHRVYRPIGILPPDQYMAVVLQATEGCSFNTCTFCTFYKERPFHIKTPQEFDEHACAVQEFLGDGLKLRRTIFLGDANALVIPMKKLLPLIDTIHAHYDVEKMGGIYAFLDGFSGEKKTAWDYATLRERGLKTVYIGLESGCDALLRFLHKPGSSGDVVSAVKAIKAGGVNVGIIILLGAGGKKFAQDHVEQTIAALNTMSLDLNDIVYFSHLVTDEAMPYAQDALQAGIEPLSQEECFAQQEQIESALQFKPGGGTPHISRYDIREFVY